ncbi:type II toxin-antitoxin system VapC family toxin [Endobacterium cereale]|uniref:type II toxin-antitoxin system VapC family toxin n=1 Tax=Endobacterium cereale TaxID=2663029 RepID=UPI001F244532|nr:type II toxin-antitoxin system VapC family toxin [Endobacterium cereale]MEB2843919.1 type II toxin-antitoxin system VapC family toxin [Endobacterium cereale]
MYVDACAIIALASNEPEAQRISEALIAAKAPITSAAAVLEAALGLARPDKFNQPVSQIEPFLMAFLKEQGIDLCDLPPARTASSLVLMAADKFGRGPNRLNLGDCLSGADTRYA